VNGLAQKLADPDFLDILYDYDVILLSETWISKHTDLNLNINDYTCTHLYGNKSPNVRKGRYSGGISIYIKNHLKNQVEIIEKNQCGIVWLKLKSNLFDHNEDVYFCNVYIPPINSTVLDQYGINLFDQIEIGIEKYKNLGKIYLSGDFNSRTADECDTINFDRYLDNNDQMPNYSDIPLRVNKDHVIDAYGRQLLSLCKTTDLIIANGRLPNDKSGEYTFQNNNGSSTVDYFLLNYHDFETIKDFYILSPTEFSDHNGVHIILSRTREPNELPNYDTDTDWTLAWDDSLIRDFHEKLSLNENTIHRLTSDVDIVTVDESVRQFTIFMQENAFALFGKKRKNTAKPYTAQKNTRRKNKWFNKECYDTRKEFTHARNIFLRSKTDENKHIFLAKKRLYNKTKRKVKKEFMHKEKHRLAIEAKSQPKSFWKTIKKQYQKPTQSSNNLTVSELHDHFQNLYGGQPDNQASEPEIPLILDQELDRPFTELEVQKAVMSQNNGKSAGTDKLIAEVFKNSQTFISKYLLKLYNHIFESGQYPESWGAGIIVPIHKGSNVDEAKNYRGITLINILSKIYSQLLLNRITTWSETHEKLNPNQFGFQKGKSTTDCIFILHAIVSKLLNEKKKLYCAFIDFEKAFDKLNRNHLLQKLINENVSYKIIAAIKAMYNVVKACVKYKGNTSEFFASKVGIKQGDPSSSLMFLFFINDITNCINDELDGIITIEHIKLFMLIFADDGILFSTNPETLQIMLNDVQRYCETWGLKINTEKTKIIIFEKGRHTRHAFNINNIPLQIVNSIKYLGVYFFKNNNWYMTQKRIAQHASFSLHNLFIVLNQIDLNASDKCKLFDSLVGSVLNYSAEVWGMHPGADIERIHTKFCRKVLHVKTSTNLDCLYGELGRFPLSVMRKIIMIRYWMKIITANQTSLLYKVYNMLMTDVENNNNYNGSNWAFQIKNILDNIGMTNIWMNQTGSNMTFTNIKLRIIEIYKQTWHSNINNSPRLQTYSLFKHTFALETYIDFIKEKRYRIALTQLRLSSHHLEIERGRYTNIERNDRKCKQCNMNLVESEFHFILVCPKFRNLRSKYLKGYYCQWPTINKFQNLFAETSKKVITNLAKYIYFATKARLDV